MVKGCQRQMVVIRCPADSIFESAHLILKNDAISSSGEDIVKQANRVIAESALAKSKRNAKKRGRERLFLILSFICGALAGGGLCAYVLLVLS